MAWSTIKNGNGNVRLSQSKNGLTSRANGILFEHMIENGCEWYASQGIACIEKTPEPMRPIRPAGEKRDGRFIAVYTKQAQPDFKGALADGSCIVFDAKSTMGDILRDSVVTAAQKEAFTRYEAMGARCYIIATLGFTDFYRIPWNRWSCMKELNGHKYFTRSDLEPYRIKCIAEKVLFLEGLQLWDYCRDDTTPLK